MRLATYITTLSIAMALIGCSEVTVVHTIPETFEGPVVILYGVSGGAQPESLEDRGFRYSIPPSGVLHLATPPIEGSVHRRYLEAPNGELTKLEYEPPQVEKIQVFGWVRGNYKRGTQTVHWDAYLVGKPNARDDWFRIRNTARTSAVENLLKR